MQLKTCYKMLVIREQQFNFQHLNVHTAQQHVNLGWKSVTSWTPRV